MKILWFTNIPLLAEGNQYNGGGWMYALRDELIHCTNVELAVAYYANGPKGSTVISGCRYYSINFNSNFLKRVRRRVNKASILQEHLDAYTSIIEDFQPDVIHVFGTENPFGFVSTITNIPTVLHIQSILNSYLNAYFPPGINISNYLSLDLREYIKEKNNYRAFKDGAFRERKILSSCKNYMGRTSWDNRCIDLFSSDYQYFHVDEMLRSGFYQTSARTSYHNEGKLIISSVISDTPYKGLDIIVKTAQALIELTDITFTWNIFGNITKHNQFIKNIDINMINIKLCGVVSESELIKQLKMSNVYVHPSYIEGSSNSVCEAQMMGLPVIACDVGGIDYMIEHNVTGLLVPANDPYALAFQLKKILHNSNLAETVGHNGCLAARTRHNKERVLKQVLTTYSSLISK